MADDPIPSDDALAQQHVREAIERGPTETWQWLRGAPAGEAERLRELVARAYASYFAHETFWLFTDEPLGCLPSSGDRTMAEGLEARCSVRGLTLMPDSSIHLESLASYTVSTQ